MTESRPNSPDEESLEESLDNFPDDDLPGEILPEETFTEEVFPDLFSEDYTYAPPYYSSKSLGMLLAFLSFVLLLVSGFSLAFLLITGFIFLGSILLYGLSSIAQAISLTAQTETKSS